MTEILFGGLGHSGEGNEKSVWTFGERVCDGGGYVSRLCCDD